MVIANFPFRVTWGKNKKYEDRFSTKIQALKSVKELKSRRDTKGNPVYFNVRYSRLRR